MKAIYPPKRLILSELHRVISRRTLYFLVPAGRTSNTTFLNRFGKRLEKWLNNSAGIVAISDIASYMNARQGWSTRIEMYQILITKILVMNESH
jgi:hypothetical protein